MSNGEWGIGNREQGIENREEYCTVIVPTILASAGIAKIPYRRAQTTHNNNNTKSPGVKGGRKRIPKAVGILGYDDKVVLTA